jgi:glycerophosphoryl diester phosphodiesterase
MPSLEEVLTGFPNRHFILHIKSNDPTEGEALARTLLTMPRDELQWLAVTGEIAPLRLSEGLCLQ